MKKADVAVALALTFAALWLAFLFMTEAGPLWRDEVATVNFANQATYAEVLAALDLVSLPAAYPTLLHAFLGFGWADNDLAIRMFGLGITILTLGGVWFAGRAIGVGAPLLLLALFGIHAAALTIIGAPRPYGLGAIAVLGTFCAVLRLVESPRVPVFAAAALFATLAVQAQYQNVLFVAVAAGAGLAAAGWSRSRRAAGLVCGVAAIAALSLVPYAGVLRRSQEWLIVYRSVADADPSVFMHRFVDLVSQDTVQLAVLLGLLVTFAAVGFVRVLLNPAMHRASAPRMLFATVSIFGSVVALVGYFFIANRPLQPWHITPVLAVAGLGFDMVYAQASLWPANTRLVLALFVAALVIPESIPQVRLRQTNLDLIAQRLERDATPGDLIVVNPWLYGITLQRYYRGPVQVITVPPISDLRFHRIDQVRARMISERPLQPVEKTIAATFCAGHRVWVVGTFAVPSRGESLASLPPAPHPGSGWSESAYTIGWSLELGDYLHKHAERVLAYGVPLPRLLSGYETAQLVRVDGRAPGATPGACSPERKG